MSAIILSKDIDDNKNFQDKEVYEHEIYATHWYRYFLKYIYQLNFINIFFPFTMRSVPPITN